jgi:DNA mismatch repair protein MutS2
MALLKAGAEPLERARLLEACEVIEQGSAVKRRLTEASETCPSLLSDIPEFTNLLPLASWIRRSIEPDGRLSDSASPKLQRTRRSLRTLRQEIRSKLEARMSDWSTIVQEPLVLIRRDRYVIPVKPGFRRSLQGIILDQSASGQTLYVEPLLIQSENDRLAELRVEEVVETYRILTELTEEVRGNRESILSLLDWLVEFDVQRSMALFADDYECVTPEMGESAGLRLIRARHPLLERQKGRSDVVPLDLSLDEGKRQLVISGANTGGKTVALKTAGLLALMAHTGCPIPAAEGSTLPYLDQVFAEIGDDQSLDQSLSTFSARLAHHVSFLARATDRSLVLLDELGAGTDPAEGSALGVAILEALAAGRGMVILTTHHEALKVYGYESPVAVNAAVEFDQEKLSPTFRLIPGVAGTSYALTVAERLGMPRDVVQRARELVHGNEPESMSLANRLETQSKRLRDLEEELVQTQEGLQAERAKLLQERKELSEQRERFQSKTDRVLREARIELHNLERKARGAEHAAREALPGMKDRARKTVSAMERARKEALAEVPPAKRPKIEQRPVRVGDQVVSESTGWRGVVTEGKNERDEWCVNANGMRVWLAEKDLTIIGHAQQETSGGAGVSLERVTDSSGDVDPDPDPGIELYLLGQRVDEALSRVDKYLDEVAISGVSFARIVHGRGTGALRRAIAEALEGHPLVKDYYPADPEAGGDGVTVVEMTGT